MGSCWATGEPVRSGPSSGKRSHATAQESGSQDSGVLFPEGYNGVGGRRRRRRVASGSQEAGPNAAPPNHGPAVSSGRRPFPLLDQEEVRGRVYMSGCVGGRMLFGECKQGWEGDQSTSTGQGVGGQQQRRGSGEPSGRQERCIEGCLEGKRAGEHVAYIQWHRG